MIVKVSTPWVLLGLRPPDPRSARIPEFQVDFVLFICVCFLICIYFQLQGCPHLLVLLASPDPSASPSDTTVTLTWRNHPIDPRWTVGVLWWLPTSRGDWPAPTSTSSQVRHGRGDLVNGQAAVGGMVYGPQRATGSLHGRSRRGSRFGQDGGSCAARQMVKSGEPLDGPRILPPGIASKSFTQRDRRSALR